MNFISFFSLLKTVLPFYLMFLIILLLALMLHCSHPKSFTNNYLHFRVFWNVVFFVIIFFYFELLFVSFCNCFGSRTLFCKNDGFYCEISFIYSHFTFNCCLVGSRIGLKWFELEVVAPNNSKLTSFFFA